MIREKYIEESFPRWMRFGGWMKPGDRGDIADVRGDILENVSPEAAAELIEARDRFIDSLIEIFNRHEDSYNPSTHNGNRLTR